MLTVRWQRHGADRRARGTFHEHALQRRRGISPADLCEIYRVCDSGKGPSFRLLCRVPRNAFPSGSLMFQAFRVGLDDAVCAVNGHDGSDSEFCGFLNDPVHLVAFDQGLSKHDRWGLGRRLGVVIDDAGVDGPRGNVGHFYAIAESASVVQAEGISWAQAETIAKMMKEVTGYADCGWGDGAGGGGERG